MIQPLIRLDASVMIRCNDMKDNNYGFTLIEIIIIIVLAGIAIGVMAPFLGSALTRSHEPLDNLGHATDLSSQMAKVLGDYDDSLHCAALLDWEIENIAGFDSEKAVLDEQQLCYFEKNEENGNINFFLLCDGTNDAEVLQVRLRSPNNPGEYVTYYFPCEP